MDINQQKAQFSQAYVHAVATVAGFVLYDIRVDDDSIDCGLAKKGGGGSVRSPRLELQLKCSWSDILKPDGVHYSLKRKNYDELRYTDVLVPRILVVVLMPKNVEQWLHQTQNEMILRRCGYWASIRGSAAFGAGGYATVILPVLQIFDVAQLSAIMTRIGNGELP